MKNVLLITDGIFHPPLLGRITVRKALSQMDGFELTHIRSMENLPRNLEDFSALVIYVHHKKISKSSLAALDAFVSNGGGLLGIHSATASFRKQSHYFEILGGRFAGHGKVESFQVRPAGDSEIFGTVPPFTVKDELYSHELEPGIITHFTALHEGKEIPVVWTHSYGKGRVFYAVPGHRTATMRNKTYQSILQRGLAWVSAK